VPVQTKAETDINGRSAASASIAKWFVPSVAILFGAIGYIVVFAQESLLGVEASGLNNGDYLKNAAEFVRESVLRLLSWPTSWPDRILLGHPVLMPYAIFSVGVAIWGIRRSATFPRAASRAAAAGSTLAIISIVLFKFVVMDAPLLKIENLVSRSDVGCWALVAVPGAAPEATCPEMAASSGIDRLVWHNAAEIAGKLVCSRVTAAAAAQLSPMIAKRKSCMRGMEENRNSLSDEFVCNLFLGILTVCAALYVLRRSGGSRGAAFGCIAVLLYVVTAPYSYGKVGTAQLFDFGNARISPSLSESYHAEDPALVSEHRSIQGVILRRDATGASILTMRAAACPEAPNGATTPPEQRASLSFIPTSQLVSFDEILKIDLITWLASQQRRCPAL